MSPGRPVALAGQSMGGQTAIGVAAARPELIDRLALLEADAAGGADAARELLPFLAAAVASATPEWAGALREALTGPADP